MGPRANYEGDKGNVQRLALRTWTLGTIELFFML